MNYKPGGKTYVDVIAYNIEEHTAVIVVNQSPHRRLSAIDLQQLQLYGNSSSTGYCTEACLKLKTSIMCTQKTHQESGPHGYNNVPDIKGDLDVLVILKSVYTTKYHQHQPDNQMKA